MRKIFFVSILALIFICLAPVPAVYAGDTGTYRILEYNVVLTPAANGEVEISCTQKWQVTGGHIPWVTVGLPNADYVVKDFGGAAKSVKPDNGGGWYGVRVDLDKDYQSGQTFQFTFRIIQRRLMEMKNGFKISYTPGWYDRAITDLLTIKFISLAKVADLKISPAPANVSGSEITWEKQSLGAGQKFTISVSYTDNSTKAGASAAVPKENDGKGGGFPWWGWLLSILGGVSLFVIIVALKYKSDKKREEQERRRQEDILRRRSPITSVPPVAGRRSEDTETRRSRPYVPPVVVVGSSRGSSSHSSSSRSSGSSGGGGGFGGRSSSCACACVACACACACAGGGGAGCTRKMSHSCPACAKGQEGKDEKQT